MQTRPRPYIGVTGFMTEAEIRTTVQFWGALWGGRPKTRDLMIGILASGKTVYGRGNKYPRRYPKHADVAALSRVAREAECGPSVITLLHYAPDPESDLVFGLDKQLRDALCPGDVESFDGVQINAYFPDAVELRDFRKNNASLRMVLQLGPAAQESESAVDQCRAYLGVVSDILVDVSGGRGLAASPERQAHAREILANLLAARVWQKTRIGFAGGLCAKALDGWVADLLREGCSIDAEGKLRDDAPGGGNLDLEKVCAYLARAVEIVSARNEARP